MTSQPEKRSPVARRTVLGTALGGAAVAALPGTAQAEQFLPAEPAGGAAAGGGRSPWTLRDTMTTDAAWAGFLRGQDLLWSRLPALWYEGPFLGDGLLGSMIYREPGADRIRFTVQHGASGTTGPGSAAAGAPAGCRWGTSRSNRPAPSPPSTGG